jgi:hypothetical protein
METIPSSEPIINDSNFMNTGGMGEKSKKSQILLIIITVILTTIVILGILGFVVFASLETAKEKGREATAQKAESTLSATSTIATTTVKKDTSKIISQSSVEAIVKYVKNNTKFPKKIDENTTWVSVVAEPNLIIRYNYVVNDLNLDDITSDDLKGLILDGVCSTPDVKDQLLDKGVTARYVYSVANSTKVFDFNVDMSDCE